MRSLRALAVVACLAGAWPALVDAGEVSFAIRDGKVTLIARDATPRQILAEWARVGKTTIVNLDRLPGSPISIELTDVVEAQALDTILRSIAGFLAVRRPVSEPGASEFYRIVVMPVLASAVFVAPVTGGSRQGAMPTPGYRQQQPLRPDNPFMRRRPDASGEGADEAAVFEETDPNEADENDMASPPGRQPGMRPGMLLPSGQPGPPTGDPNDPDAAGSVPRGVAFQPGGMPTGPGGAAVPGVIVPLPTRPGQPGQPPKLPGEIR